MKDALVDLLNDDAFLELFQAKYKLAASRLLRAQKAAAETAANG